MNSSYNKMNKTGNRFLLDFLPIVFLFSFFFCTTLCAVTSEVSKIRLRRIAGIIKEFTDANEKLTDPFVQEAIFDKVSRELTLEPDEKPNLKSVSEIAREIRKVVSARFPDSVKNIKAKAEKESKKQYKLKDKLEFVTVTVHRGGSSHEVSGIFYRFGIGGNSVVIGDNTPIAFVDLLPEDRAKFDKSFCFEKRKSYFEEKIRNYYKRKQSYLNDRFTEHLEKIAKENEALGFIYVWGKWRSPKNVTEYLIQQNIRQQQKDGIADVDDTGDFGDDKVTDTIDIPDVPETSPDKPEKESDSLQIAKLKQDIEKRQMEIVGSQYGVDASQGFRKGDLLVLIGMQQNEVNLLTGLSGEGESESLSYPKGHIESVTFFYVNKKLYKIVTKYRIGPPEGMKLLLDSIHDEYGESIETKEARKNEKEKQARLKAIKKFCPKDKKGKDTHQWDPKTGKCKKCKVLQADLAITPIKLNLLETWKGNIITAILEAQLSSDALNFTKFKITKVNPEILEKQTKNLEAERLRKIEEDKQRRINEYKKQLQ